jgi:hypothetical protein
MTKEQIIYLVIAIVIGDALIFIPLVISMRRRSAEMTKETQDFIMLSGEHAVLGPESIIFKRPMFRLFGVVGGNAVATLTDKRIIVDQLVGSKIEIPLTDIVEVKESKWYRGSYRGGYVHVILKLNNGKEIALLVIGPERWIEGLRGRTGG